MNKILVLALVVLALNNSAAMDSSFFEQSMGLMVRKNTSPGSEWLKEKEDRLITLLASRQAEQ